MLASSANCTFSVVFTPIAPGQRTATLMFSDDARGSPQGLSLSGTAVAAFSSGPAPRQLHPASVSAGQLAQYQLQLTAGAGFTGTVWLTCSGAPLGALCQVPAGVSLASGPATFTVNVTTSGPAQLPPSAPPRIPPISHVPLPTSIVLALLFLLFTVLGKNRRALQLPARKSRLVLCGVFSAALFCITFAISGCGGGSVAVTPPPPIVTPSRTSTVTVSPSATSSTGQPLQLQPIQLTLTVK